MAKLLVAVIEDDAIIAMDLERALRASGFRTWIAATSDNAMLKAAEDPPNGLVMNIRLRRKEDGIALAAALRDLLKANLPVVFTTGFEDPGTEARAAACEPIAYFIKPVDPAQVVASLARALFPVSAGGTSVTSNDPRGTRADNNACNHGPDGMRTALRGET